MTTEAISFVLKPQCVDNKFSRGTSWPWLGPSYVFDTPPSLGDRSGVVAVQRHNKFCMLLTLRALCAKRSFDAKLASLPSELGLRLVPSELGSYFFRNVIMYKKTDLLTKLSGVL